MLQRYGYTISVLATCLGAGSVVFADSVQVVVMPDVRTYSPYLDDFQEDTNSRFSAQIDFTNRLRPATDG